MNTAITTTIPIELCEKIKEKRQGENGQKWAYNELLMLGFKAQEEDWESQLKELLWGNKRLQDKVTDLNAEIEMLKNPSKVEE